MDLFWAFSVLSKKTVPCEGKSSLRGNHAPDSVSDECTIDNLCGIYLDPHVKGKACHEQKEHTEVFLLNLASDE